METRTLVAQVVAALVSLVLVALVEVARRGLATLKTHVQSERVRKALDQVFEIAAVCVAHAAQTVVADLKDPTKAGEWNAVAARAVRQSVQADVSTLAKSALATLKREGALSTTEVNALAERAIEAAVLALKSGHPSVLEAHPIAAEGVQ